jgi:hypothetical protein
MATSPNFTNNSGKRYSRRFEAENAALKRLPKILDEALPLLWERSLASRNATMVRCGSLGIGGTVDE